METGEPLSQIAQMLGISWWLFAVISQFLVIIALCVGLWIVQWRQSGKSARGTWARWRPLPEPMVLAGLPTLAGFIIAGCALYCLVWWHKPVGPRIFEPDVSILCWLYCGVFMTWEWAIAAMLNGLALVAAGGLLGRADTRRAGAWLALVMGVVGFPTGVLAIYAGRRALNL